MTFPLNGARSARAAAAGLAAVLLIGACASKADDKATGGSTTTGSGAITKIDDAEKGVVQVVATGTFRDPEVGVEPNAAGAGTGFIIDPAGIVVTNNHVVTGAATIEVYVGGSDDPVNAKVLGVSECDDLAVLDIAGDGYPYFQWFEGAARPGTEINLAGFPLGDPEYTLTRGVVAKAEAGGDTSWASLDYTLQHDAAGEPGNSGGPLLTADGEVVGIHYASGDAVAGSQFFAIPAKIAEPMVEQLRTGTDVESIGVNGEAVADGDTGLSGVWVSSVASGSPADEAGVEAGDVITSLENLDLATDGTMADYCDVLRSKDPSDPLAIQVLRFDTSEVLEGELNGPPLKVATSFASSYDDETADSGATAYTGYTTVTDDSNTIQVDIPDSWTDVDGTAEDINGVPSPSIWAAPSLDAYLNGWDSPGMQFSISDQYHSADIGSVLDILGPSSDCVSAGRSDYSDPLYTGTYEQWTGCGGTGAQFFVVVAAPADDSYLAAVMVQVTSDADLDALDHILDTFQVVS
jgi:serine protease Do